MTSEAVQQICPSLRVGCLIGACIALRLSRMAYSKYGQPALPFSSDAEIREPGARRFSSGISVQPVTACLRKGRHRERRCHLSANLRHAVCRPADSTAPTKWPGIALPRRFRMDGAPASPLGRYGFCGTHKTGPHLSCYLASSPLPRLHLHHPYTISHIDQTP